MFNDELDLLELRLNMLSPVVEKFVIVESDKTHSGLPKPFNFLENKKRFESWLPKIIYLQYPGGGVASGINAWGNENSQRNKILDALSINKPSDGLLFISDADEIPSPEKLMESRDICLKNDGKPIVLDLFNCMYFMNFSAEVPYKGAFIHNPDKAKEFQALFGNFRHLPTDIRWHVSAVGYEKDFISIPEAGWHFSTIGDLDQIRRKISSYAHLEFNTVDTLSETHLLKCIAEGIPYFEKDYKFQPDDLRFTKQPVSFLPKYVQSNIAKYRKYILF
jgi:beta-1,4-mannosyl-glycoprotein beta-1,4-N-acetylglucosaminyltransferase